MADLYGTLPPEYAIEQQKLNRQQKMAELLLAQGSQPQGAGQMVSGRYVPNSFFQNLQAPVNMMLGAYMANRGDKAALDLAQRLRADQQKLGNEFLQTMNPPQNELAGPTPTGAPLMTVNQPDYQRAMSIASNPSAPAFARTYMSELFKPRVLKEGETLQLPTLTGGQLGFNPMGGGGVTLPSDLKSVAIRLGLPLDSTKWTDQQRQLADAAVKEEKKLAGTTVNIPNFTEKTFGGQLAENQAKRFDTLQTTAEKAPDTIRAVQQNRAILQSGKFFSGSPANVQLEMAKVADVLGLGGTDTKTKAANTQTLITNAASSTLDSIAGSGLGAGQGFTDKDLKFLQEAKSFRITMTDENIRRILDLQERAARQSVMRFNDRLKTLPQASVQVMGLRPIELPVQNVRDQADAILNQSNQQNNQNR
jgi:hypothetical protein